MSTIESVVAKRGRQLIASARQNLVLQQKVIGLELLPETPIGRHAKEELLRLQSELTQQLKELDGVIQTG